MGPMMSKVGRLRYTPHPPKNKFKAFTPSSLIEASQSTFILNYEDLLEMRQIVEVIANELASSEPDLIPFFATGGIPFIFPAMEILSKSNHEQLIDGKHIHLFPGLSWNGKYENMNSENYFKSEFKQLIKNHFKHNSRLHIWSVDASFTGNAINKLIKVIHQLLSDLDTKTQNTTVSIVAIIDASRAPLREFVNSMALESEHGTFFLKKPSEFSGTEELVDNKYINFSCIDGEDAFELRIKFIVASTIISEDRAELIGAEASKNFLGISQVNHISHPKIIFDNGHQTSGTGGSSLGLNFLNWLSTSQDLFPWSRWRDISLREPISEIDKNHQDSFSELLEDSLSYYDIFLHKKGHPTRNELDRLLETKRLLKPFEIISLSQVANLEFKKTHNTPTCISEQLLLKVHASTVETPIYQPDAIDLFRLCCPASAALEPRELEFSDCHLWWGKILRQYKKKGIR